MRNIRLEIEYDGAAYRGWQTQRETRSVPRIRSGQAKRKIPTIQETIESALRKILQKNIKLIASGRTDAGVHALAQVANFKTDSAIPASGLRQALNAALPGDIVITRASETGLNFHSRYSCRSKVYRYLILNQPYPSAFFRQRAYFYPHTLDIRLMRQAARYLRGRHDFSSFCASASGVRDKVRTMKRLSIRRQLGSRFSFLGFWGRPNLVIIEIEADGFLYNMARNIAGTLLEVGRKKITPGSLKKIIPAKDRKTAGPTAPSYGLYLVKVSY